MPRSTANVAAEDIEAVFAAWAGHVGGSAKKLSESRKASISKALRTGWTAAEIIVMLDWVWNSSDERALFLRGEAAASTRTYLDLSNLMVVSKLDERCERAADWKAEVGDEPDEPAATGVTLPAWAVHMQPAKTPSKRPQPKAPVIHQLDDDED